MSLSYDADRGYERPWYARKRFLVPAGGLLLVVACGELLPDAPWANAASGTSADATSGTVPMAFDDCNAHIRTMAGRLGVAPVNIVETGSMRVVRFPASDGSVLVTCSAEDNTMSVIRSNNPG